MAALSHPNILAVHDFGRSDAVVLRGVRAAAGRDAARAARRRPAAGAQGHRLRAAGRRWPGRGARARDRAPRHQARQPLHHRRGPGEDPRLRAGPDRDTWSSQSRELAVTQAPITDAGTVLGTVGYMAPEQVRGQVVDHRADLFALGAVLYEMCTGQRAFKGATPADTMTAVLSSEPPELALVAGQPPPPALERIVRRCLEKQPSERFQSARDSVVRPRRAVLAVGPGWSGAGVATSPGRRRWMAASRRRWPPSWPGPALAASCGRRRRPWNRGSARPCAWSSRRRRAAR